jgi:hypothetical protein
LFLLSYHIIVRHHEQKWQYSQEIGKCCIIVQRDLQLELTDTDTSDANERKSSVQSMLEGYHEIIFLRGHGPSDDNQDTPPTVFTALYCEGILIAIKIHGEKIPTHSTVPTAAAIK